MSNRYNKSTRLVESFEEFVGKRNLNEGGVGTNSESLYVLNRIDNLKSEINSLDLGRSLLLSLNNILNSLEGFVEDGDGGIYENFESELSKSLNRELPSALKEMERKMTYPNDIERDIALRGYEGDVFEPYHTSYEESVFYSSIQNALRSLSDVKMEYDKDPTFVDVKINSDLLKLESIIMGIKNKYESVYQMSNSVTNGEYLKDYTRIVSLTKSLPKLITILNLIKGVVGVVKGVGNFFRGKY